MADFYTYRKEVNSRRRRHRMMIVLVVLLMILCAAAGMFWFRRTPPQEPVNEPVETQEPEITPTPEPTQASVSEGPRRLLPEVDEAAWNTSTPVESTLDQEYRSTDARMVALPAGQRV